MTKKELSDQMFPGDRVFIFELFVDFLQYCMQKKKDISFINFSNYCMSLNLQPEGIIFDDKKNFVASLEVAKLLKDDNFFRLILKIDRDDINSIVSLF